MHETHVRHGTPQDLGPMGFLAQAGKLFLADTLDHRSTLSNLAELLVPALADWCLIDLVDCADAGGPLLRVAAVHRDPQMQALVQELRERSRAGLPEAGVIPTAIRSGLPLLYPEVPDEVVRRSCRDEEHYRIVRSLGVVSSMVVPLRCRGRVLGAILTVRGAGPHRYGTADLALLEEVAQHAALAIDNARLFEEAREAGARLRFLAEAGKALDSLEPARTLEQVARLCVSLLCDWCCVYVTDGDDGEPCRRVAAAHKDPDKDRVLQGLHRGTVCDGQPLALVREVLRRGEPIGDNDISEKTLGVSGMEEATLRRIREELGVRSALLVPMRCRGRALGVLALLSEAPRRYREADVALAQELAQRAALALDNARLFEQAQEAVRMRDQFISIATHELRSPLHVLSMQLQLPLLHRREGHEERLAPAELLDGYARCERHMRRIFRLLDSLLDMSQIAAGKLQLQPEEVDLAELARDVTERFQLELQQAGCALSLRAPGTLAGRWDRLRLEQVLANLLSNAMKYGPGQPIAVAVERCGARALLSVQDRGIGIAPRDHARIFERYRRATDEGRARSLGLGLYIVREIATALGGSVRVESELGAGATFRVELPLG